MQYDYTGDIAGLPGAVFPAAPRWLRLTRSGDTITGYDSADGTHWTRVGTVHLAGLAATAQAGLFATTPGTTTPGGQSHHRVERGAARSRWPPATSTTSRLSGQLARPPLGRHRRWRRPRSHRAPGSARPAARSR